jgi:SAM-dependent methyltransferase
MRVLFAGTLFLSAALLFVVQPMTGKQVLPLAGGTPAVWTACLVFFQAAVLVGYLYADRVRRRVGVHLLVLAAAGAAVALSGPLRPDPRLIPEDSSAPVLGVLLALAAAVGLPVVAVAATAPLVQSWFAGTGHRAAANPYVLYAASNAGSLLGLFAYPFVVEPVLTVGEQRWAWAGGFAALVGLVAACGIVGRPTPPLPAGEGFGGRGEGVTRDEAQDPSPTPPRNGEGRNPGSPRRWVALAALPSAFLATGTAHLTTDVAPVPLLWVVPLGLYLASFVVVFAWWPPAARRVLGRLTPMALCFLAVALLTRATEPLAAVAAVHLLALLAVSLLCHGELAAGRPAADRLTAFYLWMSVGGVLGGLFVAVVAPVLFARLGNLEYPILVALAGLVRPAVGAKPRAGWRPSDVLLPVALACLTAVLLAVAPALLGPPPADDPAGQLIDRLVRGGLTAGLPAAIAFALVWRPVRFALTLGGLFLVGTAAELGSPAHRLTLRNAFGTLRVADVEEAGSRFRVLTHGTTRHGLERLGADGPPEPAMYYHRSGPLGRLFAGLPAGPRRVGVVGLGCGAMAAYARPGDRWTFFEIDPNVVAVARDDRLFTFLSSCPVEPEIVLGDARRRLADVPAGEFDLLVLDAFSSDAVPVHLLTREAFAVYRRAVAPGGVLAFHLSNRYLDLPPVVARLAADAGDLPDVRWDDDAAVSEAERAAGKSRSVWAAAARSAAGFGKLSPAWRSLRPTPGPVWTDDFSNLLGAWRRGEE